MKSCLECQYSKQSYPDGDMDDPLCALECRLTGEDLGYGDTFPMPSTCPLTKEGCLHHHRKKWNWIADETERNKRIVDTEEYIDHIGSNVFDVNSYCCTYTEFSCDFSCDKCPIQWSGDGNKQCANTFSPYEAWKNTEDWVMAAILARAIAQLPERK